MVDASLGVAFHPASTYSLRVFIALRALAAEHKQRDVAEILHVSESRVSQMMRGGENWTVESVQRLLMACEKLRDKAG